ncbi:MAG: hypothetical protein J6S63_04705 [Atopobiaceae bacterium]|nr:hypothetical protein [Atopobiaceae bacterium]
MPYPENFVVRLLICIVGMCAIWVLGSFISTVLIHHETFNLSVTQLIVPVVLGIIETFLWKPKDK